MPDTRALCATLLIEVGDIWFSDQPDDRAAAKRICNRCPLLTPCRRKSIALGTDAVGVWGGWSEGNRRGWRQKQNKPRPTPRPAAPAVPLACGTEAALANHTRNRETCDTCTTAHTERITARRHKILDEHHKVGGTAAGATIHRRLGEAPCERCLTAERVKTAEARAKREAAAASPLAPAA
jgi:hypothetical protein